MGHYDLGESFAPQLAGIELSQPQLETSQVAGASLDWKKERQWVRVLGELGGRQQALV
jgi:hypothetical protein